MGNSNMQTSVTAQQIASMLQGELEGDGAAEITGIAPIDMAAAGQLAFIAQPAYDHWLDKTPAATVLVRPDSPRGNCRSVIRVRNPYFAFIRVAKEIFKIGALHHSGIHETALIHRDAQVGENVSVGAFSVIAENAQIGAGSILGAHVQIGAGTRIGANCHIAHGVIVHHEITIGDRVIIQSGSVVGSDGFGYVRDGEVYHKIPHVGRVVLEDDVEIGANCTIDRATFGETRICKGTKLDNLIQVGHNVRIGENTVIAAQTGISGSTKIGKNVVIAGQAGLVGHITIGDGVIIGAQAGVTKSIPAGITVSDYPAKPHLQARREEAALRKAPDMLRRLRRIERWLSEQDPDFKQQTKGHS